MFVKYEPQGQSKINIDMSDKVLADNIEIYVRRTNTSKSDKPYMT